MSSSAEQLVDQIHASPGRFVLALAGGGSRALAALLEIPGSSRSVLEAVIPYSEEAMVAFLGGRVEGLCSSQTARHMAMAAMLRARQYDPSDAPRAGVACTASLATDRPKRGPHRVHLALQTASLTVTRSLQLGKGRRSRAEEEHLATLMVLNTVAEACGLDGRLDLGLLEGERIELTETTAPKSWQDLLLGRREAVPQGGPPSQAKEPVQAIVPGAFNPVHRGHRRMAEAAQELLGLPVHWELSVLNPDKPPLDYLEIERRTGQFDAHQTVWLTRAATFEEKSRLFPGVTFLVGVDTLRRIAQVRYYADTPAACQAALQRIADRGCRFLVFGRNLGTGFMGLGDLELPETLRSICREVPAERFREDVSSTEIRRSGGW